MEEAVNVKELSENYGTMHLLIALIMRQLNCDEEKANSIYWEIYSDVDRLIEFTVDNME